MGKSRELCTYELGANHKKFHIDAAKVQNLNQPTAAKKDDILTYCPHELLSGDVSKISKGQIVQTDKANIRLISKGDDERDLYNIKAGADLESSAVRKRFDDLDGKNELCTYNLSTNQQLFRVIATKK